MLRGGPYTTAQSAAVAGGLGSNDDNNTAIATTVTGNPSVFAIAGYFGDNNTNNTAIVTDGNNTFAQAGGGDLFSGTPGSNNTNNTATADGADSFASAGAGSDNNDMLAANAGPGETDIVP